MVDSANFPSMPSKARTTSSLVSLRIQEYNSALNRSSQNELKQSENSETSLSGNFLDKLQTNLLPNRVYSRPGSPGSSSADKVGGGGGSHQQKHSISSSNTSAEQLSILNEPSHTTMKQPLEASGTPSPVSKLSKSQSQLSRIRERSSSSTSITTCPDDSRQSRLAKSIFNSNKSTSEVSLTSTTSNTPNNTPSSTAITPKKIELSNSSKLLSRAATTNYTHKSSNWSDKTSSPSSPSINRTPTAKVTGGGSINKLQRLSFESGKEDIMDIISIYEKKIEGKVF